MNQNTINVVNSKIKVGYKYFYFDLNTGELMMSSKSRDDIDSYNTVRVYIESNTNIEKLSRLINWALSF